MSHLDSFSNTGFISYACRITSDDRPLLPDPPAIVTAFITECGEIIYKRSVQSLCSTLKMFRYLYHVSS